MSYAAGLIPVASQSLAVNKRQQANRVTAGSEPLGPPPNRCRLENGRTGFAPSGCPTRRAPGSPRLWTRLRCSLEVLTVVRLSIRTAAGSAAEQCSPKPLRADVCAGGTRRTPAPRASTRTAARQRIAPVAGTSAVPFIESQGGGMAVRILAWFAGNNDVLDRRYGPGARQRILSPDGGLAPTRESGSLNASNRPCRATFRRY